ncbi:MAG: tetratricopeptide repeat protein [Pirellulales bacterium]|nr:tetratricopeptide repeat protein [Pirellulales bacterium]
MLFWPKFALGANWGSFQPAMLERGRAWLALFLLAVVSLVLYGRIYDNDFVAIDDATHVTANPHLRPLSISGLLNLWSEPYASMYMPASYTFFAAESWLAEGRNAQGQTTLDPRVFHVTSAVLHALNTVLVFCVVRMLIGDSMACFFGALLFAWHPLQVQSVAWVSSTPGLLCACVSLLATHQYLRFRGASWSNAGLTGADDADQGPRSWRCWAHYALAFLAYLLALLCKPAATALPLMLIVMEVAWFRRGLWRALLLFGPWLLPALWLASLTHELQARHVAEFVYVPVWWLRPLVAMDALAYYLRKLVWPIGLGIDNGRSPEYLFQHGWIYVHWLLPAGLMAVAAWSSQRRAWLTAIGLFVAGVAPVLGFVPFVFQDISTVASRYVYLSMLGPALALAWFLAQPVGRAWRGEVVFAIALLGLCTVRQTGFWQDTRSLAERGLDVNERSTVSLAALAQLEIAERDYSEAEELLRRAAEFDPEGARVWTDLGSFYVHIGRAEDAKRALRQAARVCSLDPLPHVLMAKLRLQERDYDNVILEMRNLLRVMPDHWEGRRYLAVALFHKQQYEQAALEGERIVNSQPNQTEVRMLVATSHLRLGRYEAARAHLRAVQAVRPADANVRRMWREIEALESSRKGGSLNADPHLRSGRRPGSTCWRAVGVLPAC